MRFWVEKWADLNVYKRPPLLDANFFMTFDQLLMLLVVVQVMLATHYVSAAVRVATSFIVPDQHRRSFDGCVCACLAGRIESRRTAQARHVRDTS